MGKTATKKIGADVKFTAKISRWGFIKVSHYRGRGTNYVGNGDEFEKTPFKVVRTFSFWRFFHELELAFGWRHGVIHQQMQFAGIAVVVLCINALEKLALGNLVLPFIAGAIASDVISGQEADTISITVASNSNRAMYACFGTYQGSDPSGITYAGSALTELVDAIGSFGESSGLWERLAPATGTNNLVVSGVSSYRAMCGYSLYNVDQTLSATTNEAGGDSSGASVSVTPLVDNCWIICSLEAEPVPTLTTSGGVSDFSDEGQSYQHMAASHFVQTTAAAKTSSYSLSYGARWNICVAVVKPFVATSIPNKAFKYPNMAVTRSSFY